MHYKKFFSAAALAALLSLSNSAFSDSFPAGPEEAEDTSYYVRAQYNLNFKAPIEKVATTITGITAGITKVDASGTAGQTGYVAEVPAKPLDPYGNGWINGSVAFGYKMDDMRVELEGSVADLSKNATIGVKFKVNDVDDKGSDIEDIKAISAMVNAYYDVSISDEMPITPYVGIGIGGAYISNPLVAGKEKGDSFMKSVAFAYQAKIGVSYAVTPEIKVYGGARYFGTTAAKFGVAVKDDDKITVGYGVIGAEAGLVFNF